MNNTPAPTRGPCKNCGDAWAHHQSEETCWGPACNVKPRSERCRDYDPQPPKGADSGRATPPTPPKKSPRTDLVSRSASTDKPDEAPAAPGPVLPKEGTAKREVYDVVVDAADFGATDAEMVKVSARRKSTITSARQALVTSGLICDSGLRRKDDDGREGVAWVVTAPDTGALFTQRQMLRDDITLGSNSAGTITVTVSNCVFTLSPAPGDPVDVEVASPAEDGGDGHVARVRFGLEQDPEADLYTRVRGAKSPAEAVEELREAVVTARTILRTVLTGI